MTKKTKIVNIEGDATPAFKSAFAAALANVVLTGKMPPRAKRRIRHAQWQSHHRPE